MKGKNIENYLIERGYDELANYVKDRILDMKDLEWIAVCMCVSEFKQLTMVNVFYKIEIMLRLGGN